MEFQRIYVLKGVYSLTPLEETKFLLVSDLSKFPRKIKTGLRRLDQKQCAAHVLLALDISRR